MVCFTVHYVSQFLESDGLCVCFFVCTNTVDSGRRIRSMRQLLLCVYIIIYEDTINSYYGT
jgi:hypothetical protein